MYISSGATSVKQVPALHKKVVSLLKYTDKILDYGAGKWDLGKEYLEERHFTNVWNYDPENRSIEENSIALSQKYDVILCSNVLNVIPFQYIGMNLTEMYCLLKEKGKIFITVYERNKTGVGEKTSKGWQSNKKLTEYVEKIKKEYQNVTVKNKMIIIEKI